jgi:hypothetical protein
VWVSDISLGGQQFYYSTDVGAPVNWVLGSISGGGGPGLYQESTTVEGKGDLG